MSIISVIDLVHYLGQLLLITINNWLVNNINNLGVVTWTLIKGEVLSIAAATTTPMSTLGYVSPDPVGV